MAASQIEGRLWLLQERLKQERLFVTKEKECIRLLNTEVQSTCEKLFHVSWIASQQWRNLQRLQAHPAKASYANQLLDNANFVDAYKNLGYLESKYGDFLKSLRENPRLVASSLAFVDQFKINIDTKQVARLLLNSLYGNCLLPEDENYVLILMKALMEFQILKSEQPLMFFRSPRNWSFTLIFDVLIESLFSAKLYLTAALHTPILHVLAKDSKIMAQLPFICTRFVQSLQEKLYCFPPSLRWLICQLFNVLRSSGVLDVNRAKGMVSELLFNYLVCPAIINPEPYGINSNMQVSKIARLNLQQISSLLCKRCTSPWEGSVSLTVDIFNTIDVKWISSFVDSILEGADQVSDFPEQQTLPGLCRTSVLITQNELQSLITYLRMIHSWEGAAQVLHLKELGDLLDLLPPEKVNPVTKEPLPFSTPIATPSPSASPKVPHKSKKKIKLRSSKHTVDATSLEEDDKREKSTLSALAALTPTVSKPQRYLQECSKRLGELYQEQELVLVVPLGYSCVESPGMLPEEKVLGIKKPKPVSKKQATRSNSDSGQSIRPRSNSTRFTKLFHNLSIEKELNKDTESPVLETTDNHSHLEPTYPPPVPVHTQLNLTTSILDAPIDVFQDRSPRISSQPDSARDSTISSGSSARASTLSSLSSGTRDSSTLDSGFDILEEIDDHSNQTNLDDMSWSHEQGGFRRKRDSSSSGTVVGDTYIVSNRESQASIDDSLVESTKSESSSSGEAGSERESYNGKKAQKSGSFRNKVKTKTLDWKKKMKHKKEERPKSMPESELRSKSNGKSSGIMKQLRRGKRLDKRRSKQSGARVYQEIDESLDFYSTAHAIPQSQVEVPVEKTPKDIIEGLIFKYKEMATQAVEDTQEDNREQTQSDEEDEEDIDEETRFDDTKRKLRIVLNQADFRNLPWLVSKDRVIKTSSSAKGATGELMTFLHVQLAEAINLQNRSLAAQLHETIRSVKQLSQDSCSKILESIESDYQARMPYLAYLTRSRQTLLTTESHLDRLIERVQKNQMLCQKCFTTNCITLFLEVREGEINSFITNFRSPDACPTADEKCKYVEQFLDKLEGDLGKDDTWLGATVDQLLEGNIAIERDIMARIYNDAFYPNGQIDMERDKNPRRKKKFYVSNSVHSGTSLEAITFVIVPFTVPCAILKGSRAFTSKAFTKHVERLQKVVGITHKAIRIPKLYRKEAPWPSAQQELSTINAYK
ncbi:hypothetical protein QZH41_013354, partial [Actinostola sp. cb2023]